MLQEWLKPGIINLLQLQTLKYTQTPFKRKWFRSLRTFRLLKRWSLKLTTRQSTSTCAISLQVCFKELMDQQTTKVGIRLRICMVRAPSQRKLQTQSLQTWSVVLLLTYIQLKSKLWPRIITFPYQRKRREAWKELPLEDSEQILQDRKWPRARSASIRLWQICNLFR